MSTVTLLLHGAGSCPETARRLLTPAVAPGSVADAIDARGSAETVARRLASVVEEHRRRGIGVARVAGISLGAHAAALWASRTGATIELALVMPAWTGAPNNVAAATAGTADEVGRLGARRVLDRLRADPGLTGDWVLDELERGWASYDDISLVVALRAAAASIGPTLDELRAVAGPVAVVALRDDPLHPESIARAWAESLPTASLQVVPRMEPAHDRGALGHAAVRAFAELSGSR